MHRLAPWLLVGAVMVTVAAIASVSAPLAEAAPFVSPGTGVNYTMLTLQAAAGTQVNTLAPPPPCHYRIREPVVISFNDTLNIGPGCLIEFDGGQTPASGLTIEGQLLLGGNASAPVRFVARGASTAAGQYAGLSFVGPGHLPSLVDWLSINYSTFGIQCAACQNLSVSNFTAEGGSGDGVFSPSGAQNLTLVNITVSPTSYTGQSAVGLNGATNVTGWGVSATSTATLLTLWNGSNISFAGPFASGAIALFGAWIDRGADIALVGFNGTAFPTGILVNGSTRVRIEDAVFNTPVAAGITLRNSSYLTLRNITIAAAPAIGIRANNVSNSSMTLINVNSIGNALSLADCSDIVLDAVVGSSVSAPVLLNRTSSVRLANSTLTGGIPGAVTLNASVGTTFRNVKATGGSTGFYIRAGSGNALFDSNGSGNLGDGLSAALTSGLTLSGGAYSSNGGRGIAVNGSSGVSLSNFSASSNGGEGVYLAGTTGTVGALLLRLNGLDGLSLNNTSVITADTVIAQSNLRHGVWLRSNSSLSFVNGSVFLNGVDGVRVEGASSLNVTNGDFQNNTGLGLNYSAGTGGSWRIDTQGTLADNPAILAGSLTADAGGIWRALRTTVDLRGSAVQPFLFVAGNASSLWLGGVTLRPAAALSRYAFDVSGGSSLVLLRSNLTAAGVAGGLPAVQVTAASLTADASVFWNSRAPIAFAGSIGSLTTVVVDGTAADAITASASTLNLSSVTLRNISGAGLSLSGGSVASLTTFAAASVSGSAIIVQSSSSVDVAASTVESAGSAAVDASGAVSIKIVDSTLRSLTSDALSCANVSQVELRNVAVSGPAAGVRLVDIGDFLAENLTAAHDGVAVDADRFGSVSIFNSSLESFAKVAVSASHGDLISITNTTLKGLTGAVLTSGVLQLLLQTLMAEAPAYPAVVMVSNASSMTLMASSIRMSVGFGVKVVASSNVSIRGVSFNSSGSAGAVSFLGVAGANIQDIRVEQVGGGGLGFDLYGSQDVNITNATVVVQVGAQGLLGRLLTRLNIVDLTVVGGSYGLAFIDSTEVLVDGAVLSGILSEVVLFTNVMGATFSHGTVTGSATAKGIHADAGTALEISNSSLTGFADAVIRASDSSSVDVWLSTLDLGTPAAGYVAAYADLSGMIRFFDTATLDFTFFLASGGRIEVYWTLRLGAVVASQPAAGASIELTDAAGATVRIQVTGADGFAPATVTLEFWQDSGVKSYATPFEAHGSFAGGLTGTEAFVLHSPKTVIVTLSDEAPPTLASRTSPIRVAANQSFTFQPLPGDTDNVGIVSYQWSFVNETGQLFSTTVWPTTYTFRAPGRYTVSVRALDGADNAGTASFVVWVNAPPSFVTVPGVEQLVAIVNLNFVAAFSAADPDPEDAAAFLFSILGPAGITAAGGVVRWLPTATGVFPVTIYVTDGLDQTSFSFSLLVGSFSETNRPPVFTTDARENADIQSIYLYEIRVSDPDAGDTIVIQLVGSDAPGITLTQLGVLPQAELSWDPSRYFQRGAEAFNLTFNVSIRAWDTHTFTFQNFTITLRNPPDKPPEIRSIDNITLGPGEIFTFDLRQFAVDPDDDISTLRWSLIKPDDLGGATIGFDTEDPFKLVIRAPAQFQGTTSFFVTFVVKDSSGLSDRRVARITLESQTATETAFPWLLLLAIVAAVGVAFAVATRRRYGFQAAQSAGSSASPSAGAAPEPGGGAMGTGADAGFPFYLEGAALFHEGDNLIASASNPGADVEPSLRLVPAAVRSVRGVTGPIQRAPVEGREAAWMADGDAVLAVVGKFAGDPSPWLLEPLQQAMASVQGRAAELDVHDLARLSGDAALIEILRGLLLVSAGSSVQAVERYAAQTELRVASLVEHLGGYVRLKVAVENNTNELAAEVRLSLEFDEHVLRLERTEPPLDQRRDKIILGNLRPGERKAVAFYFDPQICARSLFNATASYEDARGRFHSVAMRTRPSEVVCPAFSTPRHANTAMLRRLLQQELTFRDSKYFRFPPQTPHDQVFEACKRSVLVQDVQLVREFAAQAPYQAEAWFFGETKVGKAPMVIWTTVFGADRIVQFSVASNSQASITGLLAELGRRLVDSRAGGGLGAPIETLNKAAAAEVAARSTLLSKSQSAEIDAPDRPST